MTKHTCSSPAYNSRTSRANTSTILDDLKGWSSCWGRLYCFTSRKRSKYQRPVRQLPAAPIISQDNTADDGVTTDLLNQAAILPPVMCAPPSSPISGCQYSESSCQQSPATVLSFPPSKSGKASDDSCIERDSMAKDFVAGSFPLDNILVTPTFSALTTAPTSPFSTAPFTPPPELAHLTTPSSPEVSFGELLASSIEIKCCLSPQAHDQYTFQMLPPTNLELVYQLYPCSPIDQLVASKSRACSETSSPLPERVCFLERDDAEDTSLPSTSIQELNTVSGFDDMTSEICHTSSHLMKECGPEDMDAESKGPIVGNVDDCCTRPWHVEALPCFKSKNHSSLQLSEVQTIEESPGCTSSDKLGDKFLADLTRQCYVSDPAVSDESGTFQRGKEDHNSYTSHMVFQQPLENGYALKLWQKETDITKCCPTCGELTFKCRALSDALQQTKEKLMLIERRMNQIHDRERKWKQLIQWMQLSARLQQENVFRLSNELTWQEQTLTDMQGRRLAELGIDVTSINGDMPITRIP